MNRYTAGSSTAVAPRTVGALLVIACGALAAWWGIQLGAPRPVIAPAVQPTIAQPDPAAAAALFGTVGQGQRGTPDARLSSVRVVGVIAHQSQGTALLSVDGAAPRAFAVGDTVGTGLRLIAVTADGAVFDRFGERIEVAAPARGTANVLTRGAAAAQAPAGR